jgi:hypothetical protein
MLKFVLTMGLSIINLYSRFSAETSELFNTRSLFTVETNMLQITDKIKGVSTKVQTNHASKEPRSRNLIPFSISLRGTMVQ